VEASFNTENFYKSRFFSDEEFDYILDLPLRFKPEDDGIANKEFGAKPEAACASNFFFIPLGRIGSSARSSNLMSSHKLLSTASFEPITYITQLTP
jgi:hypothetical protein